MHGVPFSTVRNVCPAQGEFFSPGDNTLARRVAVPGPDMAQDLFGGRPAVGATIKKVESSGKAMAQVQRQASVASQIITSDEGQGGGALEGLPGLRGQCLPMGGPEGPHFSVIKWLPFRLTKTRQLLRQTLSDGLGQALLVGWRQRRAESILVQRHHRHLFLAGQALDAVGRGGSGDQEPGGIDAQVLTAGSGGKLIDALLGALPAAAQLDLGHAHPVADADHQVELDLVVGAVGPHARQHLIHVGAQGFAHSLLELSASGQAAVLIAAEALDTEAGQVCMEVVGRRDQRGQFSLRLTPQAADRGVAVQDSRRALALQVDEVPVALHGQSEGRQHHHLGAAGQVDDGGLVGWRQRVELGQDRRQVVGIDLLAAGVGQQALQALRHRQRAAGADEQRPLRLEEAIRQQDGHGLFADEGEVSGHGRFGGPDGRKQRYNRAEFSITLNTFGG
jgi:hypothetical protein